MPEHGYTARSDSLEDAVVERLGAHSGFIGLIRALVRAELARVAPEPLWTSQVDAARRGFGAVSTLRDWQRRGLISRGRRGRVRLDELRRFLAQGEPQVAEPTDRDAERVRRVAAEIERGR